MGQGPPGRDVLSSVALPSPLDCVREKIKIKGVP